MSTSPTTYLGPYVECKLQTTKIEVQERACLTNNCSHYNQTVHDTTIFCPFCGSRTQVVSRQVDSVNVNEDELEEEIGLALMSVPGDFGEALADKLVHIWLTNMEAEGPRSYYMEPWQVLCVAPSEFAGTKIAGELDDFCDRYQKEIKLCRQHYGENMVTVKWGLVNFSW